LGGLTFAKTPFSAISRLTWSAEASEARRLFKMPPKEDSSFHADLEQATKNRKAVMKFVSLRMKRAHRQGKLGKQFRVSHESLANPTAVPGQIHTYAELRQQIHDDLRVQHPEWVQPDGKSPMCDSYEARLMELLDPLIRKSLSANADWARPNLAYQGQKSP